FMVGGDPDVLERCRPILETTAGHIYALGGVGAAALTKNVQNMMQALNLRRRPRDSGSPRLREWISRPFRRWFVPAARRVWWATPPSISGVRALSHGSILLRSRTLSTWRQLTTSRCRLR